MQVLETHCGTCGHRSRPVDRFCELCGATLVDEASAGPTSGAHNSRRVRPVLLVALLIVIVAGAVVLAISLVHARADHSAADSTFVAAEPGIGPELTSPPTPAPWIPPPGFTALLHQPNFAYKFLPVSEIHCTGFQPCWNVTVISRAGCDYGISVTLNVEHADGTVIDSATDEELGVIAPGQATLLEPENATGQSDVVGDIADVRCF
jgi:hypothetical protein